MAPGGDTNQNDSSGGSGTGLDGDVVEITAGRTLVVEAILDDTGSDPAVVVSSTELKPVEETPEMPAQPFAEDVQIDSFTGGVRIFLVHSTGPHQGQPLAIGTRLALSRNGENPITVTVGQSGILELNDLKPGKFSLTVLTQTVTV